MRAHFIPLVEERTKCNVFQQHREVFQIFLLIAEYKNVLDSLEMQKGMVEVVYFCIYGQLAQLAVVK